MGEVIYCNRCGTQNSALAKFCANCGTPFGAEQTATVTPNEISPGAQGPADVHTATSAAPHVSSASPQPAYPLPAYPQTAYTAPMTTTHYAGFWIRFVAVMIDALALGIVVWPISGILALMIGAAGNQVNMPGIGIHLVRGIVIWSLFIFAGWIYEAGLESSSKQATLGKMALGLKVTDEKGQRISFARASGRFFSKLLSRMILFIGYIMAGFTARKQALHDMIAGTLVVRAHS
jgi:uncharacterized RDD family membrane protein YckC